MLLFGLRFEVGFVDFCFGIGVADYLLWISSNSAVVAGLDLVVFSGCFRFGRCLFWFCCMVGFSIWGFWRLGLLAPLSCVGLLHWFLVLGLFVAGFRGAVRWDCLFRFGVTGVFGFVCCLLLLLFVLLTLLGCWFV